MKLRKILRSNDYGRPSLVAEIELSEEQMRNIRTRILLEMDVVQEHLTRVYWFHGEAIRPCTHPPAPPELNVIDTFKGTPLLEDPESYVNQRLFIKWVFLKRT